MEIVNIKVVHKLLRGVNAMSTLSDEIIKIVEDKANNNPAPITCKIKDVHGDYTTVTVQEPIQQTLSNLRYIGEPIKDDDAVIIYPNGDQNNPFVICSTTKSTMNTILALGLGLFKIKEDDGHLYVELPVNVENFFEIDEYGHLLVTLPTGASNDYILKDDGHLYYTREEI